MCARRLAHDRNAELAEIDASAAAASIGALQYRLDGKHGQAAILANELEHARNLLRIEEPAADLASTRTTVLTTDAEHAHAAALACRRMALEATQAAHQAAAASLQALHADLANEPDLQPAYDPLHVAPDAAVAAAPKDGDEASAPPALQARLESAAAEAERWRRAAEELHSLHEWMAEVVVVDLDPTSAERAGECGNSSMRARLGQMVPAAPTMPTMPALMPNVSDFAPTKVLSQLTTTSADWLKNSAPTTNGGKFAAGAALLGAGIGIATTGPVVGTALVGVAGAAAFAGSRPAAVPAPVPTIHGAASAPAATMSDDASLVPPSVVADCAAEVTADGAAEVTAEATTEVMAAASAQVDVDVASASATSHGATGDVLRLELKMLPASSASGRDAVRVAIAWL